MTTASIAPADLLDLVRDLQPRASVFLHAVPKAVDLDIGEDLRTRWRKLAEQLRAQGIDKPTLAVIEQHIAALAVTPVAAAGYALLASAGTIHLAQPMPGVVTADRARYSAPPELLPLLAWWQQHPAYVSVLIDRAGAEVTAVPAAALTGNTVTVTGPDDEIERNAPGGWAQARYQRRAEDSWHHNAVAVAQSAVEAFDAVKADLLVIAGDVRAVQMLRDHLHKHVRRDLHVSVVRGGRSPDGSTQAHLRAVADAVAEYANTRTAALLDQSTSSPIGDAVEGVPATLAALAEGRLQTLFVTGEPASERQAWAGPGILCTERPQATPDVPLIAGGLADIAVRAALLTGASVHVLTAAQAAAFDGHIGGLCRYRPAPAVS